MRARSPLAWLIGLGLLLAAVPVLAQTVALPTQAVPLATPTPEPGIFRAYQALRPPTVDGNLADWPVQGGISLTAANASYLTGRFDSPADGSVTCRALWDAAALYIGCDVSDDVLIADSGATVWKDDVVELAFDGKNDNVSFCGNVFCPDDHKYELRVDGTVTDDARPPNPPVVGAVAQRSGGYRVEIAIPVANLDAGPLVSGKVIGFNLGLIDDDDGGETDGHLFWMGRATWDNATGYGDLVLDAQAFPPPGSTATPTPTRTATPTPTPTAVPVFNPAQALPLACDQNVVGDTRQGENRVASYGCVPYWPEHGPEQIYLLTLEAPTDLDLLLADLSADLDLFLLSSLSPAACLAYGDSYITVRGLAAGTYYVVVDGFGGAAGSYRLQAWCPLAPPAPPTPTPTATPPPPSSHYWFYVPLMLRGEQ